MLGFGLGSLKSLEFCTVTGVTGVTGLLVFQLHCFCLGLYCQYDGGWCWKSFSFILMLNRALSYDDNLLLLKQTDKFSHI